MNDAEHPLTIKDATCLMAVLENDIPETERAHIAFLLLVLSSNPSLAEKHDVITRKRKQHFYDYSYYDCEYY